MTAGARGCGLVLLALTGCAAPVSPRLPTEPEWVAARSWLHDLRATQPDKPFGAVVSVSLREPHTGKTFDARGAVAVDPHHAMRMILIGPAGATALDVWATLDEFRLEIPAANVLRRGGRAADPALPIAFFRWWFLDPVGGRLLASFARPAGERSVRLVLRAGEATVDLVDTKRDSASSERHELVASRLDREVTDRIDFVGASLGVTPGDHATYDSASSGVHVEVAVESRSDAPDPVAFADPDTSPGANGR